MTQINLKKVRSETPVTSQLIHFNNAGASLISTPVHNSVLEYLQQEQLLGGYEAEELYDDNLKLVYQKVGTLINCKSNEVALFENATLAWNTIFWSIPLNPGQIILTSESEYGSNYLAYLQRYQRDGTKIIFLPNTINGSLDLEGLRDLVSTHNVGLMSLSHIPTNNGVIYPLKEVGEIAYQYDIPFLVDACQSVGQLEIDTKQLKCDFLTAAGRKFLRGPRGTAFAFIKEKWFNHISPYYCEMTGVNFINASEYDYTYSARRFEFGESSIANRIGLGTAIDYALNIGMHQISQRTQKLARSLREALRELNFIDIHDSNTPYLSGLVTFTLKGVDPKRLKTWLRKKRVNLSVSEKKWAPIDMNKRGLEIILRASVHYYNTEEEIEYFIHLLKDYYLVNR